MGHYFLDTQYHDLPLPTPTSKTATRTKCSVVHVPDNNDVDGEVVGAGQRGRKLTNV